MASASPTHTPPPSSAKRHDILEVATQLFATRGFEKTSIQTLAAEAHVSTSTIYVYFRDKNDLLDQVIQRRLELLGEQLRNVVVPGDPLQTLVAGTRRFHRFLSQDPLLPKLLTYQSYVSDRRIRERALSVMEGITQHGIAAIEQAVQGGQIRCSDPQALNAVMRLSFQGWLMNSTQGGDEVSAERLTEMLVTLVKSLAPKAT